MTEIWKTIEGFSNYEVSNMGRVRSLPHRDRLGRIKGGCIIKPQLDGRGGYVHVGLWENGKATYRNVHRLVAEAFIDNPSNYLEVNHKDENKKNNAVDNLEWCTHTYNNNYGSKKASTRGNKNPQSKLQPEDVDFIMKNHKLYGGNMSTTELAKKFNMSLTGISAIVHKRRWHYATLD